ncbi:MAG TPA: transcription termination/antitermination NusG family protein [Candidatus Koribacter sp.]
MDAYPTIATMRGDAFNSIKIGRPVNGGWWAIWTHPRYEKKVAEHLVCREVETYLPTYTHRRRWRNRQNVALELPLFPGYVFARLASGQRSRVLSTPGVLTILGDRKGSDLLPDRYIEALRIGLKLSRIVPYSRTAIGDRVRIVAGPLAGIEGVLTAFRSELRIVVSIWMIRQSVSIEVARDEVEPVRAARGQMADTR